MLEAILFPRNFASNFSFLAFILHFMLDPDSALVSEQEPECITVPVPLWQKVAVPAVSVPASVPLLRSI